MDTTSFISYMEVQKKITLKCTYEQIQEHIEDNIRVLNDCNDVLALNVGIFNRDLDEVPYWIKNLKLYSK